MKKSKIVQAVKEVLKELSTTSGVGGYLLLMLLVKMAERIKLQSRWKNLATKK